MKSAEEIRNNRKIKLEEKLKENQNRINEELLECEKALNKYEDDIEDTKPYVQVPLIIKTKEVKTLLEQQGYYIDKTNQDIPVNTTRIYLDKESYDMATKRRNFNITSINERDINSLGGEMHNEQNKEIKERPITIIGDKEFIDFGDVIETILNHRNNEKLKGWCY